MTERVDNFNEDQYDDEAEALSALKAHADKIGIKYHPSIGYDTLYEKVQNFLKTENAEEASKSDKPFQLESDAGLRPETTQETFARVRKDLKGLVRVQIQCLDPLYKDWDGQIFTFSNELVTIRRYVPFNAPWHVEKAIATMLEEKQYQYFVKRKHPDTGFEYKESKLGKSFNVAYLDKLSDTELAMLAIKQTKQGI